MDGKIKAKLKEFLINGDIQKALAFIELIETHDGNYTDSQRRSAWKYMSLKAEQLNDAGLDIRAVLKPTFNIPWTKDNFHDYLFIPFQKKLFRTKSMRSLKKSQVSQIYDLLERELGEKFGLENIPFPHDPKKAIEQNQGYKTGNKLSEYPQYEGEVKF